MLSRDLPEINLHFCLFLPHLNIRRVHFFVSSGNYSKRNIQRRIINVSICFAGFKVGAQNRFYITKF